MEMIDFHLFCHCGLHFDHRVEQVLKMLKFFAFPVERHWRGLNWSNGHSLRFVV